MHGAEQIKLLSCRKDLVLDPRFEIRPFVLLLTICGTIIILIF